MLVVRLVSCEGQVVTVGILVVCCEYVGLGGTKLIAWMKSCKRRREGSNQNHGSER